MSKELDAKVAEVVFGVTEDNVPEGWPHFTDDDGCQHPSLPSYSERITDAWQVVEKMRELTDGDFHLEATKDGWAVSSCQVVGEWKDWVYADTAPEAICRAALSALEE